MCTRDGGDLLDCWLLLLLPVQACMSGSCRRIFALANSDFTTHEDVDAGAEGGLSMNEFMVRKSVLCINV